MVSKDGEDPRKAHGHYCNPWAQWTQKLLEKASYTDELAGALFFLKWGGRHGTAVNSPALAGQVDAVCGLFLLPSLIAAARGVVCVFELAEFCTLIMCRCGYFVNNLYVLKEYSAKTPNWLAV